MSFRITGLPAQRFAHLFALSDEQLAAQGAVRRIADGRVPGYPCRVSLTDSREGDELILVNYEHHGVNSPYRMRFAIYVREGEITYDAIDEVPAQLRTRTLAVRAFDHDAMMVGCEMVDGRELEAAIGRLFANAKAAYLQVYFAVPGCYAGGRRARVDASRSVGTLDCGIGWRGGDERPGPGSAAARRRPGARPRATCAPSPRVRARVSNAPEPGS